MIDYSRLFQSLPGPHMILTRDLRFLEANPRYLEVTGHRREELIGRYVFDAFPETSERQAEVAAGFARALAGEANSLEHQKFSVSRGEEDGGGMREAWWTLHHVPLTDGAGGVCGLMQQAEDMTAEVIAERMRAALRGEFDHRVKNLLSTVSSIARRTAMTASSTETFVAEFEARIQAMARTHSLLVTGNWDCTGLGDLINGALEPFYAPERAVCSGGPAVSLTGRQAQALGLALHELAVNAAKFGALGVAGGRLHVGWTIEDGADGARELVLLWAEEGAYGVAEPQRTGFGTTLIERVLPIEIDGSVEREFGATGMRCTVRMPLPCGEQGRDGWPRRAVVAAGGRG